MDFQIKDIQVVKEMNDKDFLVYAKEFIAYANTLSPNSTSESKFRIAEEHLSFIQSGINRRRNFSDEANDLIVRKSVKAVGVTYNNPNGENRQDVIKELSQRYGQDLSLAAVEMKEYQYQGQPAYYIVIDNNIVGNISSDLAIALKKMQVEQQYTFWLENGWVIGGEFYTGEALEEECDSDETIERDPYYGITFTLCLASPDARAAFINDFDQKHSKKKQNKSTEYKPQVSKKKAKKKKQKGIWKLIVAGFFVLSGIRAFGISTIIMDLYIVIGGAFVIWWVNKDWEPNE